MAKIPRTLITGANGFIGRHLTAQMLEAKLPVVATTRQKMPLFGLETIGVGDLSRKADWTHALKNIDAVVHLAGRAHILKETEHDPQKTFMLTNADATLSLAAAAKAQGVKKFINLSSIAIFPSHQTHLDAQSQPSPQTHYGHSKWAAEQGLDALQDEQFEVINLRPPLVFGPGVAANFERLMSLAWSGLPLPLAGIHNQRSLIYVGNLATLIIKVLHKTEDLSGSYLVSDPEMISTSSLLKTLSQSMERPFRMWSCPQKTMSWLLSALGRSIEWQKLSGSLTLDGQPFRQKLDPDKTLGLGTKLLGMPQALDVTAKDYAAEKRKDYSVQPSQK